MRQSAAMGHLRSLALISSLLALQVVAGQQIWFSSPSSDVFQQQVQPGAISSDGLTAALLSLLSSDQDTAQTDAASQQVEHLLQPNLWHRPRAVAAVQLAGLEAGADTAQLLKDHGLPTAASYQLASSSNASPAAELVAAVGAASRGMRGRGSYAPLDHTGLPGCSEACLETSLQALLERLGGSYAPGNGSLAGSVSLPAASGSVQLDLTRVADRLWAVEAATLYQTGLDAAAERRRRVAQGDARAEEPVLLEATLVSLQGLADAHGTGSRQLEAASSATLRTLGLLQRALADAYGDRVAMQLTLLGDAPQTKPGLTSLLAWREGQRRKLLQMPPGLGSLDAVGWSNRAAAVMTFLILVAFLLAGVWAISNMDFKRDSLLYASSSKMD